MSGDFSAPDLHLLLAQGMRADLHWFPADVTVSRLAETLAGMANSNGGTILVGVSPRSGQIIGVSDAETARDLIFQAALLLEPTLILPIPDLLPVGDTRLLRISVPRGLPHVYSLEGRYLGREGRHNAPLTARQLRQRLLERGLFQFESQIPPDTQITDLDNEQVEAYLNRLNLAPGYPPEEALLRRGCLRRDKGELKPTYAGLLLFGRYPNQWLPNATILAARFAGRNYSDEYVKQEIGSRLPDQLRLAEVFVRDHIHAQVRLDGLMHQETPEYPLEAVRELLVNAVAHRDYNIQGDNIHIHLFSDHLEVRSPGGLPGPVTLDNLLNARFSRNPILVQVLADMGFVERLGYGLKRVVAAMREHGMRPPQFDEAAGSFRVILTRAALQTGTGWEDSGSLAIDLNERQLLAIDYLANHHRITNRSYQELCPDVHPETLRRDLADLVSRNLLLKIGDKRATYYILKSPAGTLPVAPK